MPLIIGALPNRKGTWLSLQQGGALHALAKFRNEASVERFKEWVRSTPLVFQEGDDTPSSTPCPFTHAHARHRCGHEQRRES
ncbi:hypothetical protein [Streptomyces sp. S1]|uniref:hypothetical protein n=1 Tax=Streptomyces sp. S1 TaxID=718288 RepID=UPI003D72F4D8